MFQVVPMWNLRLTHPNLVDNNTNKPHQNHHPNRVHSPSLWMGSLTKSIWIVYRCRHLMATPEQHYAATQSLNTQCSHLPRRKTSFSFWTWFFVGIAAISILVSVPLYVLAPVAYNSIPVFV